jgi:hypothetical protein
MYILADNEVNWVNGNPKNKLEVFSKMLEVSGNKNSQQFCEFILG